MKIYVLFLIILISTLLGNCKKETAPLTPYFSMKASSDDSQIPDSIKSLYKNDASRLSLRYLSDTQDLNELPIEIPENLVQMFYTSLIRLYNSTALPGINFICSESPIHTFPNPEMTILIVTVDSTAGWVVEWQKGNSITGEENVDTLVMKYDLTVKHVTGFIGNYMAILTSSKNLNLYALAKKFEDIAGVKYSHPEAYGGSGNDIQTMVNPECIKFFFNIGWGDCPAGCTSNHFWEYEVWTNGTVYFIEEYGTPLEN